MVLNHNYMYILPLTAITLYLYLSIYRYYSRLASSFFFCFPQLFSGALKENCFSSNISKLFKIHYSEGLVDTPSGWWEIKTKKSTSITITLKGLSTSLANYASLFCLHMVVCFVYLRDGRPQVLTWIHFFLFGGGGGGILYFLQQ